MDNIKEESNKYFKTLKKRSEESRIYRSYQLTGLSLTGILKDMEHKSLYIKLAKTHDNGQLIALAKDVAERKDVKNKGAYFMSAFKMADIAKVEFSGGKEEDRRLRLL